MKLRKTEDVNGLLLASSAFFLPILSQVSLVIWLLSGLFIMYRRDSRLEIRNHLQAKPLLFLFPVFYLVHLAGLLWTSNFNYAGLDLSIKLPLVFVPLVIGGATINAYWWKKIISYFVSGCIAGSLIMISQSYWRYSSSGDKSVFFYAELSSVLMHPTYASMFINMGILFCFWFLIAEMNFSKRIMLIICSLFLLVMLILLSSRTAQISALLSTLGLSIYLIFNNKSDRFFKYSVVVSFIITLILFQSLKVFYNRYEQVVKAIRDPANMETYFGYNSITGRVEIWREMLVESGNYWLTGVGTGDVKDELLGIYKKNNFRYGLDKNLNAHNQYLQTWFALGIPGLTLLLLAFFLPLSGIIRRRDKAVLFFLSVIILNSLTESILERQKGVLLSVFIISLMMYKPEEYTSGPSI